MNRLAADTHFPDGRASTSRRTWLAPLLLVCLLAVWFGAGLNSRALWTPDEGRYAEIPREMVTSGNYLTPRLDGVKYFEKPPLVYWLTAASIKTFGLHEWSVRLWPAVFALVGCMMVYLLGRRLYGPHAGLLGAVVLALSPLYDLMGGALILDMPLTGWLTIAMTTFLLGTREAPGPRRRWWFYAFYAAMALAVLTKGLVGIVIPGMIIAVWIALLGEWRLLREMYLISGALLFFAIAAPWHVMVSRANPEFAYFYFIHEHFQRYLTQVHHRYKPAWFFVPVLLAGMFPWSALLPAALRDLLPRLWRERKQQREVWFLLLWALLPFLFYSLSSSKLIPYILPVLPPLAVLFGRLLAQIWDGERRLGRATLWGLLVIGVICAGLFAALPTQMPDKLKDTAIASDLTWGLYAVAAAALVAGLLPLVMQRWVGRRAMLITLGISGALIVLSFAFMLPRLDGDRSVKALAEIIKPQLRPGDEVMTYRDYYQDLPVYLQRRVTIVDWTGELEFGASIEDTSAWMIDDAEFHKRWAEPHRVYVLAGRAKLDELRAALPGPQCVLGSTRAVVMITNRECHP